MAPKDNRPSVSEAAQSPLETAHDAVAVRTAEASASPAAVAPVAVEAKPTGLRIVFEPRTGQTKRGARYLANASMLGCFGNRRIVAGGYTLALDGRDVRIYMPGSQYSRDVRPLQIPIDGGPITVAGKTVTHRDDPAGEKDIVALETAIRDAWAAANMTAEPYGKEWPLSL